MGPIHKKGALSTDHVIPAQVREHDKPSTPRARIKLVVPVPYRRF